MVGNGQLLLVQGTALLVLILQETNRSRDGGRTRKKELACQLNKTKQEEEEEENALSKLK